MKLVRVGGGWSRRSGEGFLLLIGSECEREDGEQAEDGSSAHGLVRLVDDVRIVLGG
jgi:hypothetical protein